MNWDLAKNLLAKLLAYGLFVTWSLVTLLPLFWMFYSSFKSNGELTRNIYAFPHDLFANYQDEYEVIGPSRNLVLPYDPQKDTRERLIIESTSISPGRRLMVFFLLKDALPPRLANLAVGERLRVSELPPRLRSRIGWQTVWFNYRSAFSRGNLLPKFVNSVVYALVSTGLVILLGAMIGFATSKMNFPGISRIVLAVIGLGYLISIPTLIIPLFLMLSRAGLTNSHLGLLLVYTATGLPLSVLLMTQFMRDLPDSLIESGFMDGANSYTVFSAIILPMTLPVMITIGIISFLGVWNEFLLVLVLASSEATKSLPVGVFSFSSLTGTQLGWQLAALVIATLPAILVYLLFSKQITRGVVAGAVKG